MQQQEKVWKDFYSQQTANPIAATSAAAGWEKWDGWYRQQWRPVMEWMARAVEPAPGMLALDVACGTGQPALLVAERVKPGGRVIAIDHDAKMLAAAERLSRAAGIDNIELRQLDMHDLRDIADSTVDVLTFGFALMFSPNPAGVVAELRRVLKPGGRFALSVWDYPAQNPFLMTVFGAVAQVVPMPPPIPNTPGPFRLAPPGELEAMLRAEGFTQLLIEPVPMLVESASRESHWEMLLDMAGPVRKAVDSVPEADRQRIRDALFEAIELFTVAGRVRVLATPLCASGRKS